MVYYDIEKPLKSIIAILTNIYLLTIYYTCCYTYYWNLTSTFISVLCFAYYGIFRNLTIVLYEGYLYINSLCIIRCYNLCLPLYKFQTK